MKDIYQEPWVGSDSVAGEVADKVILEICGKCPDKKPKKKKDEKCQR